MLASCPKAYDLILTMIDNMTFESTPAYEEIIKLLEDICQEAGISMDQKYDWESGTTSSLRTQSLNRSPSDQLRGMGEGRPSKREF